MSCAIVLTCARRDCDASVTVLLDQGHWERYTLRAIYDDATEAGEVEDGWGWDYAGLDYVMHCPDHREPGQTTKEKP